MRDRRQFIKVGGSTLALAVAGCMHRIPEEEVEDGGESEDGEDGGMNQTQDGNETESMDGEDGEEDGDMEDGEEAQDQEEETVSLTVVDAGAESATVELNQRFNWTFTVRNEGDAEGEFSTTVSRRKDGGSWEEISEVNVDVPPGEQRTRGGRDSFNFVGTYDYRIDEVDMQFSVEAQERRLGFGESYTNPDGIVITVSKRGVSREVEITGSYVYREEGEKRIKRPSEGNQFALVEVESRNPAHDVIDIPGRDEFVLSVGDDDYETVEYLGSDSYQGGELRTTRRGVIAFEISKDYGPRNEYEIFWVRRYPGGRASAVWSTSV